MSARALPTDWQRCGGASATVSSIPRPLLTYPCPIYLAYPTLPYPAASLRLVGDARHQGPPLSTPSHHSEFPGRVGHAGFASPNHLLGCMMGSLMGGRPNIPQKYPPTRGPSGCRTAGAFVTPVCNAAATHANPQDEIEQLNQHAKSVLGTPLIQRPSFSCTANLTRRQSRRCGSQSVEAVHTGDRVSWPPITSVAAPQVVYVCVHKQPGAHKQLGLGRGLGLGRREHQPRVEQPAVLRLAGRSRPPCRI